VHARTPARAPVPGLRVYRARLSAVYPTHGCAVLVGRRVALLGLRAAEARWMTAKAGIVIEVEVPGLPRTAGSKRVFMVGKQGEPKRPIVVDDSGKKGRDWRADVQHAILRRYQGPPLEGALEVSFVFTVPRPRSHFGRRGLRPTAPTYPIVRPDMSKFERAVEDAATGLLWYDDAQIVSRAAMKRYGDQPGVLIFCRTMASAAGDETQAGLR